MTTPHFLAAFAAVPLSEAVTLAHCVPVTAHIFVGASFLMLAILSAWRLEC
jgi:hypothetical protein